jgi:hypothetical protein
MLRITDFSKYELVSYKHEIIRNGNIDASNSLGNIFIPEISILEYENIKKEIRLSAFKLAEKQLADLKEDLNVPIPKDTEFKDPLGFWTYKAKPQTEYEAELHGSTLTNAAMFLHTVFVCDGEGKPLCPYTEARGEILENRASLYAKLLSANGFMEDYQYILLNIEKPKKDEEVSDSKKKK